MVFLPTSWFNCGIFCLGIWTAMTLDVPQADARHPLTSGTQGQENHPHRPRYGHTYIVNPCLLSSMLVKTEEASGPLTPVKGEWESVFTSIEGQGIPLISDPPIAEFYSNHYISDAPALCDWAFPLGCLLDYERAVNLDAR